MATVDLQGIFRPDGLLARSHPHYEPRPGQVQMAEAVAESLASGRHLIVEAGTGTGKTLAYLVPACLSGLRVVISTGTKTLQDQVIQRDIPFISERLGIPVRATSMKGRENYLCLRRFREFRKEPMLPRLEEAAPFEEVAAWAARTSAGDRAEVPGLPDDALFWRAINARGDVCTGTRCADYEECFLTRMKRRAAESEIIVVNHHLFFADLALRQDAYGQVLPDYDRVVFDEAHLLEEIATQYFGVSISSQRLEELASDAERLLLATTGGSRRHPAREADLARARRSGPGRRRRTGADGDGGRGEGRIGVPEEVLAVRDLSSALFSAFAAGADQRMRFKPREIATKVAPLKERLSAALDSLAGSLVPLTARSEEAVLLERRAREVASSLGFIFDADEEATVTWAEKRGRGVVLVAAPIDVSGPLVDVLFGRERGVVLTSATLSVGGDFSFTRARLGIVEGDELVVPSPFDYARQAVLYLPRNMPDPRQQSFIEKAVEEALALIEITKGRAFLLFTSFSNLRRARDLLEGRLRYPVIVQGEGSKAVLLERFRGTRGAVLLGTSSFWHGVDVQGEALSLVVVDRLPFDVPGDPLVAARIERIRARGGNPFAEYQLPSAVIELKQGLGRLIRSGRDRGVLAVLDPRIRGRSYGRMFLESLPPFPVVDSMEAVSKFFREAAEASGGEGRAAAHRVPPAPQVR